jgi:D-alanyl-D-alanine dipeptidase
VIRIQIFLVLVIIITGCGGNPPVKKPLVIIDSSKRLTKYDSVYTVKSDSVVGIVSDLEKQLRALGLVNIHDLDSSINVDLKYSTLDNFIGLDVYGNFDKCFLQQDVAIKLVAAEKYLKTKFPTYSLVVFDAVRPLHIQQKMWDTIALPPGEKIKYLSNPKHFSLHNYGAAVDISIVDENGMQLDMGTPFDFFGEKAHPIKEQEFLATGELTKNEISNRQTLRNVMRSAGFFGIQTEWWHFNSCTREVAATKYQIVE